MIQIRFSLTSKQRFIIIFIMTAKYSRMEWNTIANQLQWLIIFLWRIMLTNLWVWTLFVWSLLNLGVQRQYFCILCITAYTLMQQTNISWKSHNVNLCHVLWNAFKYTISLHAEKEIMSPDLRKSNSTISNMTEGNWYGINKWKLIQK